MKKFECEVCGYVYDPQVGDLKDGIDSMIAFEHLPDDWECPVCGVGKDKFKEVVESD